MTWAGTREKQAALVLALALGGGACGGEAPAGRSPEPLLVLRGTTALDPADTRGLTPALVFLSRAGDRTVKGKLTEDFPSRFRFDVTTPPPESVMLELSPEEEERLELRGPFAEALLALLPSDHPDLLPDERVLAEECDADRTRCTRKTQACIGSRCRERTYDCTRRACEELGTSGAEGLDQGYITRGAACAGGACFQSLTACTLAGDCFSRFSRCDYDRTTVVVDFGTMLSCDLSDQTGDASIMTLSDIRRFATTHYVTYVTRDNPGFNGLDLTRGYNLVASRLRSPEEYMESVLCASRVEFQVFADYNAANGTTFDRFTAPVELDLLVRDRRREACARAMDSSVVPDALEAPLALELGPYPGL